MHWVVNTCLRGEGGYHSLIEALERQDIPYTLVRKPPFADYLISLEGNEKITLDIEGPVFVAGTSSMREVSRKHGWEFGYIDAAGIEECLDHWGDHMLNADARFGTVADIVPPKGDFFVRPDLDTKSFSGEMTNSAAFEDWRKSILAIKKGFATVLPETRIMTASPKTIWSEYRCAVIGGSVKTASRYKTGRTVAYSGDVGENIINFANARVAEWNQRPAFALDIADTPAGLKVIETNSISSSGFYALDMGIFVHEISQLVP